MTVEPDASEVQLSQLMSAENFAAHRPVFAALTNSVLAGILLDRFRFFQPKPGKPFYKFKSACKHSLYKPGDSWCEELGFSEKEFDSALKVIGTKVTKGVSKKDLLATEYPGFQAGEAPRAYAQRFMMALRACIIYWTDGNRLTWYQVNYPLLTKFLLGAYLDNHQTGRYLINSSLEVIHKSTKTGVTKKIPKKELSFFSGQTMTDSGQTTKKEKDSPAGENLLRYLRQQQLIYLLRVLVIGLSTFEENQSPESGEFEAPEEMLPGLEKLDKSQRARMQVAVCFAMNLRRPETKSEWKILSRWIAFFSGQIKKESHRRYQTEWYNEQFSDIPMRSNKLAGFFIWYRTEMSKQGVDVTSLPATLATLHKRAEDFELAPNRDSAIRAGISKMAQLLGEPDPIREAEKPVSAEVNETLFAELDGLKQKMGVA